VSGYADAMAREMNNDGGVDPAVMDAVMDRAMRAQPVPHPGELGFYGSDECRVHEVSSSSRTCSVKLKQSGRIVTGVPFRSFHSYYARNH
jgi:hypothetical protein